jgi:hypothetical protein
MCSLVLESRVTGVSDIAKLIMSYVVPCQAELVCELNVPFVLNNLQMASLRLPERDLIIQLNAECTHLEAWILSRDWMLNV